MWGAGARMLCRSNALHDKRLNICLCLFKNSAQFLAPSDRGSTVSLTLTSYANSFERITVRDDLMAT